MKYKVNLVKKSADTLTPVLVFLRMRDKFPETLLLESSDYNSNKNSFSFIVAEPLEKFIIKDNHLIINNNKRWIKNISVKDELKSFIQSIQVESDHQPKQFNGLYGFTGFESVKYFDHLNFSNKEQKDDIPLMHYAFYRYIIAINHYNDEVILLENVPNGEQSKLKSIENLVFNQGISQFKFKANHDEQSFITDEDFMELVRKGKEYCQLGEVFQIVFARRFTQSFTGDEFNIYRALR